MSENKKRKTKRKHHTIKPYFTNPLIYFLLSMIIVIPIALLLLRYSISFVHKAQPSFDYSISDIEINDSAYKENVYDSGTVSRPVLHAGDKVGELQCREAGLSCNVYYGENRISVRNGAGMKTDILPGDTGICEMFGERSNAFRAVKNLKVGDTIKLNTSWGKFTYSVSDVVVDTQPPEDTMPQSLLLICAGSDKVFSNLNEEKLYVLADIESGPQLEEVQL